MIRRRKSNLPKWRYEFDCRKCDNIREVHADEKERVLRCECFTPIPEDEEGEK